MYTNDKKQERVRRDCARFARKYGVRCAARRYGVSPGTVTKWRKLAKRFGDVPIPAKSSRPPAHPRTLSDDVVQKIIDIRLEHHRSAEVVHRRLKDEHGIEISLSSVKRILDRHNLLRKRSPWKRFHAPVPRPEPKQPGALVEVDTIHLMKNDGTRAYVFTCLDVYSRWAYARAYERCTTRNAIHFLKRAQAEALFPFMMIQSDYGPEFTSRFTSCIKTPHRHSRVRRPNNNAHLERFNRTLQTEVDLRWPDVSTINKLLPAYLRWYNEERHHFGLNLETPLSTIRCFQAID